MVTCLFTEHGTALLGLSLGAHQFRVAFVFLICGKRTAHTRAHATGLDTSVVQDAGAWFVRSCPGVKKAFEEFWGPLAALRVRIFRVDRRQTGWTLVRPPVIGSTQSLQIPS